MPDLLLSTKTPEHSGTRTAPGTLAQHRGMKLGLLMACGASATGLLALTAVPHLLVAIAVGAAVLTVLVYFGVAVLAVWSSKPARRKAAAAVLGQILAILPRHRGRRRRAPLPTTKRPPRKQQTSSLT
jgi:Flp pilus assembly protein TadB